MWLVGVVSRRRVWLVEVGESMGVATGCGCKEVYRFPHTTYPYSSCTFAAAFLLFVYLKKCFPFLFQYFFWCNYILCILNNFSRSINTHTGVLRQPYEGCTYCFIHEEAHTNVRFISCDGHKLY